MFNKIIVKRIYTLFKFLLFLITFIVFLHTKENPNNYYYIVFFVYFLDIILFFGIENKYFKMLSLTVDIAFVYFIARILSIEELIIFSVAPIFFSCLFIECFLSMVLLTISFLVVFFYSDINILFAIISYISVFTSSYLTRQSIKQKEVIKKKEEFDKEFNDKVAIAKRISLEFAHEIRNPLMGISGAIEILKHTKDKAVKAEMINIANQEIERANNLTRDFLNLEKPYEINKINFELCNFLKDLSIERKSLVDLEIRCKEKTMLINADREMLVRMFNNLIRNSMEAKAKAIIIDVSKKEDYIVFIVEDDGIGINTKNKDTDKIFLPFFTTKEQGSGLGLSICKQIAEAHFGSIEIYSNNAFKIKLKRM